ncbi:cation:proton antiporter regulatory subunit [Natrinema salifodinae]|uniref:Potassium/proton antiporter regulatory subunit, CPA2 family n=1 Tax=Natrinema salifodinae TaxID=1202768 RepID=A0A1I0MEV6_9EURY|nr:TrkA C-terminal domain-containing protein [Natrinema salifodinae]SEV86799.1 potassium/proton antiporter regulatory subunit, CPA2 family [Natrinema salifodinae]
MAVYETDLPGVGKKFEIDLDGESQLIIVTHNTGKRELFFRQNPNADSEKLVELSDKLARQVGTIMEGAYFQPIRDNEISTVLDGDTIIEWAKVTSESELVDRTLAESGIRQRTGVSIIAIQRGDKTIQNPPPDVTINEGDTLVSIGDRESHKEFERLAAGDTSLNKPSEGDDQSTIDES